MRRAECAQAEREAKDLLFPEGEARSWFTTGESLEAQKRRHCLQHVLHYDFFGDAWDVRDVGGCHRVARAEGNGDASALQGFLLW